MRIRIITAGALLALISVLGVAADSPRNNAPTTPVARNSAQADAMRLEGEKRFRANCGRCHAAPQKYPPRMMATIVRHMRVRATITDEDMRLVLFYMTQ
jgi:cytochrome c5